MDAYLGKVLFTYIVAVVYDGWYGGRLNLVPWYPLRNEQSCISERNRILHVPICCRRDIDECQPLPWFIIDSVEFADTQCGNYCFIKYAGSYRLVKNGALVREILSL